MTTDLLIKKLFEKVKAKKVAIQKANKPYWETSGMFGYTTNSLHDRIDIRAQTDERKLIEILAFLIDRKEKYEKAAEILGSNHKFTWLGFTVDEWEKDLKLRVDQLNIDKKNKELSDIDARLNALITPELRAQMELESIQELLK